jgi:O-antigen ligase
MNPANIAFLPEGLFYLLILMLPFEQLGSLRGVAITKMVGFGFFLLSMLAPRRFYASIPKTLLAFVAYTSIGLCIDLSSFPLEVELLNELVRPLLMCVLMLAAYNLSIHGKSGRIVAAIWLSSLVYAVAQLLELNGLTRIQSTVIDGLVADRVAVLGGDENFAACFISLSVLAGAIYGFGIVPSKCRFRLLALAGSGVGFCAILKTGSRGGLAALLVGLIAILFTTARRVQRLKCAAVLAILLGVITLGVLHNPAFKARVLSSVADGETAGRTVIWSEAVRLFGDSPICGFGSRMCLYKLGEKTGHDLRGTHNLFLAVLLSSGVIGLAFFLYFYGQSVRAIWSHRTEGTNPVVFAWFMMALAGSLSINTEIAKWFWLIVALALAAGKAAGRGVRWAVSKRNETWERTAHLPSFVDAGAARSVAQVDWRQA